MLYPRAAGLIDDDAGCGEFCEGEFVCEDDDDADEDEEEEEEDDVRLRCAVVAEMGGVSCSV